MDAMGGHKARVRQPTLRDVARELNISVTTVSKVINDHDDISEETRIKVWNTIHRIGYTPNFMAANLRRKHGSIVGLMVSDISQPYFTEVIKGYETTLNNGGYQTMIFTSFEDPERELALLRQTASLNLAGIIIDIAQNSQNTIEFLRTLDIPFVLSNRYVDKDKDYYVVADNIEVGYQAVRHLLSKKPMAPVICINGPDSISPTLDRYEGYLKAINEAGIEFREELVFNNHYGLQDGYSVGIEICQTFQEPISVFCSTDVIALGVIRAALEMGRSIPGDIAVIGVDDIEFSSYSKPTLTTMALPKGQIGSKSADKLIQLIENKVIEVPREYVQPELKIRETT